ncbi:MAG: ABC transporter substrate-binding protein [Alphaproteobacteria bacterium]|nr:ABC transporter substrate-binding protein [Alphaproteobacteria bacterium]
MKKTIFAVLFAILCLNVHSARADVDAAGAEKFVQKMTDEGIEQIINANISKAEKQTRFKKLFNDALDLDFIGKYVLGRYWRTATPQQKTSFINTYRELNTKVWSERFDEFKGKSFIFKGTTPSNSEGQIFVNTVVPMEQGEPATVVWRVKQTGSSFKIIDIIIEKVSLTMANRNEYTAYIKNNGGSVDALISNLKTKLK